MEPDVLPDAEDLWWSWVVLAALARASGDEGCGYDARHRVLHMENSDGSWVRMQRVLGSRAVLWGTSSLAPRPTPDARLAAPDWAVTEATLDRRPAFLAWWVHGEWDSSTPGTDQGAVHLLRPILTVDPRAVAAVRPGGCDAATLAEWTEGPHLEEAVELVREASEGASTALLGAVRARLRDQLHGQMRDSGERDRMLIQRPPALVAWMRVNGPAVPFEYAVMVVHDRLTTAATNTRLPDLAESTLVNVLRSVHAEEATEESGAWMFARVWSTDGVVVSFDRAFDSWPEWFRVRHVSQGPTLDELAWEMRQRSPAWRPAWASLLP